jgi:DedD protein
LDSLVKERLTGAIILVVLIVLLVPELLSGPSRSVPAPQAAATSSSSEEPPLRSYTIDLADESHAAATSAGTSNAAPQASGPAQPTAIVEHTTETPAAQQQAATGDSASTESSPDDSQAATSQASLSPATTQHDAAKEQAQPASPRRTAAALAEKPSSTGGWMVQLGVFANHANADRLAEELKGQGFQALVSESSGGSRPLWRVRAGPVAERAAAEQLNARLRAAGHAGSIVPK